MSFYPSPRAPRRRRIPPSFHRRFARPSEPPLSSPGCGDCRTSYRTKPPPAAPFPPSTRAAPQVGSSSASESDSSLAAVAQTRYRLTLSCHRPIPWNPPFGARCCIRNVSRADAYAAKNSAATLRLAEYPEPLPDNPVRPAESQNDRWSVAVSALAFAADALRRPILRSSDPSPVARSTCSASEKPSRILPE